MAAGHREAARSVLDGGEHGARLKRAGASAEEMTMRDTSLLQLALGLVPPWAVIRSEFDAEARQLDIHIDFAAGSRFACPCCGAADCPAYDTEQMSWRHLDFFQHQAFLYTPCAACALHPLRDQDAQRALGAAGQRLHLAVRGVGHEPGLSDAGQRRGPSGRRT